MQRALQNLGNLIRALSSTTLALLALGAIVLCLALPVLTTLSGSLFGVAASVAAVFLETPNVLDRQTARQNAAAKDLLNENKVLRSKIAGLEDEKAVLAMHYSLADDRVQSLRAEVELLEKEGPRVSYRGKTTAMKDAIEDTSQRILKNAVAATSVEVGSSFGEAVPFLGAVVVVGSAAFELQQTCSMLNDLRQLEAAIDAEHPIDPSEYCGQQLPSLEEVWSMALNSPIEAYESARARLPDLPQVNMINLPDFQWQEGWDILIEETRSAVGLD